MLADKNSCHAHSAPNTHTGDEYPRIVLFRDIETGGDLAGTSWNRRR